MPLLPPVLLWTAGLLGAVALVKFVRREHSRVNEELARARADSVSGKAERAAHPTLRRDPLTGVYRP